MTGRGPAASNGGGLAVLGGWLAARADDVVNALAVAWGCSRPSPDDIAGCRRCACPCGRPDCEPSAEHYAARGQLCDDHAAGLAAAARYMNDETELRALAAAAGVDLMAPPRPGRPDLHDLLDRRARVTVTAATGTSWAGRIAAVADHPAILLEQDDGTRVMLAQSLAITEAPPASRVAEQIRMAMHLAGCNRDQVGRVLATLVDAQVTDAAGEGRPHGT